MSAVNKYLPRLFLLLLLGLLAACTTAAPVDCKCQSSANLTFSAASGDYNGLSTAFTAPSPITLTGNLAIQAQAKEGSKNRQVNIAILSPVAGQNYSVQAGQGSNGFTLGYREDSTQWVANGGSLQVGTVNTTEGTFTYTLSNVTLTPSSNTNETAKGSVTLNGTISVVKTP